jgi:hypothetical protein
MSGLIHTVLGLSSLIAHVLHSPPPPPANNFVIGLAVINTLFQMGEVLFIFADLRLCISNEGFLFKIMLLSLRHAQTHMPNPKSRKMRHYFIHLLQMRKSDIHDEACYYSIATNEACHYSNTPIEACHYSNTSGKSPKCLRL